MELCESGGNKVYATNVIVKNIVHRRKETVRSEENADQMDL